MPKLQKRTSTFRRSLITIKALTRRIFLSNLEHRSDFFLTLLAILAEVAVYLALIDVIFNQVKSLAGYTKPELFLVYGFYTFFRLSFMSLFAHGLKEIPLLVTRGELDHFLLKPIHPLILLSFQKINFRKLPVALTGLTIIAFALQSLDVVLSLKTVAMLCVVCVVAGLCFYGLLLFIYTSSFFFGEISPAFYIFNELLQLSRYPISIFKGNVAFLFIFLVPLGLFGGIPSAILLNKITWTLTLGVIVAGVSWFLFSLWFWNFAVRRYTSGGG